MFARFLQYIFNMSSDNLISGEIFNGRLTPNRRSGHVSVAVGNQVYIWGGYFDVEPTTDPAEDRYLAPEEIWIYNADICQWLGHRTQGERPPGLSGACAVAHDRKMYVMCGHHATGNSCETYALDLHTLVWTHLEFSADVEKPSPRDKAAAWEHNKRLYLFGGYGAPINWFLHGNGEYFEDPSTLDQYFSRGWNNQLLVFDVHSSTWSNPCCQGAVPSPRAAHAVTKLDDRVYLFGGRHNNHRLNDLYSLDITTLHWVRIETEGECPAPRTWHSFTRVSDDHILMFGGYSQHAPDISGQPLNDTWLLDVREARWHQVHGFETGGCLWHTAVYTGEEVVMFGGCTSDIFSQNERQKHSNSLLRFRLSPKSLTGLALDAVFQHRHILCSQWQDLPKCLSIQLYDRLGRLGKAEEQTKRISHITQNTE